MPSPLIPRSKSVPNISDTQHSPSDSDIAASVKTSKSDESPKASLHRKISNDISRQIGSDLTVKNLEEFNRRNAAIQRERRNLPKSPYYKGLTDQSLAIELQKAEASPVRDHTAVLSSSLILKVQEWSNSWLSKTPKEDRSHDTPVALPTLPSSSRTRAAGFKTTQVRNTTMIGKEIGIGVKDAHRGSRRGEDLQVLLSKEKSLRERVSEPPSAPLPQTSLPSPPPTPSLQISEQDVAKPSSCTKSHEKSTAEEEQETDTKQSDKKYIWADKHRPNALKDFICNRDIALELQALAKTDCGCLFIFEGPPGVGKRTMIFSLLRELFGPDKVQAREECQVFYLKGEAVPSIQVNVKVSTQHVEINLSETKGYEKHVIVELLRGRSSMSSRLSSNQDNCKAIILCEADKLSTDVLQYTKWLLGRYKCCTNVFFCCSDASKLQPIKSICKVVQLRSPSDQEIINVLDFIAKQEGIDLPHQLALKFAINSKRNLRQAIRSFEATWHFNSVLKEDQEIMIGWEDDIANIARNIIKEQSPRQLYDIRQNLQHLIEHNVSAEFIFDALLGELKKNLDDQLLSDIDNLQQKYKSELKDEEPGRIPSDPLRKTVQQFMKIEEFTAKFMSWYKINVVKKVQL